MNTIYTGDSLKILKDIPSDSVDLICTDPPYGYSFMGKDWDKSVPSIDIWRECLRVLKAGAFAFVMSSPRQDVLSQMIVRLSEAGFNTSFSSIYWTYASGFPKAHAIGKKNKDFTGSFGGVQLKPAVEVIIICMKPLSQKTFLAQALDNNHGITWLDDCRIPYVSEENIIDSKPRKKYKDKFLTENTDKNDLYNGCDYNLKGRFPANLLVSDDSLQGYNDKGSFSRYFDLDKWAEKTFPFLITPKASKSEKNKGCNNIKETSKPQRDEGQELVNTPYKNRPGKTSNNHPTVKPLKLMSYLITMGSRKDEIVLDPFCGSGTTLLAAKLLNRKYIGVELSQEYVDICNARLSVDENPFFG